MARPKKETVDYFPHNCSHGKTMFILEQKYGNDGYAFWFKLLELLGDAAGHYLDLNDDSAQEFLQAKTHLSDSFCDEILTLLAKLGAIDPELWGVRVVWSQNFVDGISVVYTNRRARIPSRPSFYTEKPTPAEVSTDENPQSRVEESIGEKSTEEKSTEDTQPKNPPGKSSKVFADDSEEICLSETLRAFILKNNPKAKTPDNLQKWAAVFDKMLRLDKRTPEDIGMVMEFSQTDDFWMSNILSATKLREKFDQLYLQAQKRPRGDPKPAGYTHQRTDLTDLQKVTKRKTMIGLEDEE